MSESVYNTLTVAYGRIDLPRIPSERRPFFNTVFLPGLIELFLRIHSREGWYSLEKKGLCRPLFLHFLINVGD